MLFLAASKGSYFQWTQLNMMWLWGALRGQTWRNIAAALNSLQQPKFSVTSSQKLFEIVIHFELQNKNKTEPRDEENCLQNQIIQKKEKIHHRRLTIVIAYKTQITEVFECLNKTVTGQSSSQRKSRRLSGKLHCLNFVFPAENETLGPVCLGCET